MRIEKESRVRRQQDETALLPINLKAFVWFYLKQFSQQTLLLINFKAFVWFLFKAIFSAKFSIFSLKFSWENVYRKFQG